LTQISTKPRVNGHHLDLLSRLEESDLALWIHHPAQASGVQR